MPNVVRQPLKRLAPLWSRPGFLIRRLHQLSVSIFYVETNELDLTPVQFGALSIVAVHPGIEQLDLGAELGIDRANVADVVSRLVKSGHLVREISERDRRARNIFLTESGKALVCAANRRFKAVQKRLLAPLDDEGRELFIAQLNLLIESHNAFGRTTLRFGATEADAGRADG